VSRQLFEYHPQIGYRFIPGLKARVDHEGGGYLLRTNQAGFRCDHEFQASRTPGRRRLLLFGDSYTAGDGVSNKDRYGDQLERLIPDLELYNFGLSGSGTDQQYLIWREFARNLQADLLVISVLVENIRRVAARFRPYADGSGQKVIMAKPYFTLDAHQHLSLHHIPVPPDPLPNDPALEADAHLDRGGRFPRLRRFVQQVGGPRAKQWLQRWTGYQPLPQYNRADHPDWQLLRAILTRWITEADIPVLICPIPLYQYVEQTASPAGYRARFAELAAPPRVNVHDPLPDFWAVPRDQRRQFRFPQDPHPTPAAHQLLAQSLAQAITPLLPQPTGAR
jgi:lysophospholipase L1-like esterase